MPKCPVDHFDVRWTLRIRHRHKKVRHFGRIGTKDIVSNCLGSEVSVHPVMWSETVGLRTRPVSDQKYRSWSWSCRWSGTCCVVKHDLVTLVVIMILKDTETIQVLFIVSLFCAWNITTEEINSGIYLKVCKCLCLLPMVLILLVFVLRIWSCLHHCAPFNKGCPCVDH